MTAPAEAISSLKPRPRLRVLFVEDNPGDVKLMAAMLQQAGYELESKSVDTPAALQKTLSEDVDVIVSDYNLHGWTAITALEIVKSAGKNIPVIVVSGSLGDEAAADCIKQGAVDYVLKDRMARLPTAVRRAIDEAALRRKQAEAEAALRVSDARYRRLIEANIIGVIVTEMSGTIVSANEAFLRMAGYTREDLDAGSLRWDTIGADGSESFRETAARVMKDTVAAPAEKDFVRKDARHVPVLVGSARLDESPPTVASFIIDLTERKHLEEQFRQAQKMEAVGRLAGGIAHDFNNLLMIISSYADLLLQRGPDPAFFTRYCENVIHAAQKATGVTRQLLAFSRRQPLMPSIVDVNKLVADICKMLPRLIGADVDMTLKPGTNVGKVEVDTSQMEQVVLNLVVNARDAMPEGGKLSIETANAEFDEEYCRRHPSATPGQYVMLSVSDSGIGMDAATQARIFEPFFTTKEVGKGTGLGLSTVFGIVKQSGGFIWLYSEVGKGTTFRIYLPRVDKPATVEPFRARKEVPQGSGTILLVEDEESLREAAREFLQSSGYIVVEAANGSEALKVAENHAIDLVITDMIMPGMRGTELVEKLCQDYPDVKVLYMSGYPEGTLDVRQFGPRAVFLQKPFTLATLAGKVQEALGG